MIIIGDYVFGVRKSAECSGDLTAYLTDGAAYFESSMAGEWDERIYNDILNGGGSVGVDLRWENSDGIAKLFAAGNSDVKVTMAELRLKLVGDSKATARYVLLAQARVIAERTAELDKMHQNYKELEAANDIVQRTTQGATRPINECKGELLQTVSYAMNEKNAAISRLESISNAGSCGGTQLGVPSATVVDVDFDGSI